MLKKLKNTFYIIAIFIIVMLAFSPFKKYNGFNYSLVKTDIIIKAPVAKVFAYLGNSANASKWSTFVNHITPINITAVPDGQVGSIRRCFKNKNEQGIIWDEQVIDKIENLQRKISIFNPKGFPIFSHHLATQQLYKALDSNTTKLSFTLFFNTKHYSWWDILKMHFASYTVAYIYKKNLKNIKKYNES